MPIVEDSIVIHASAQDLFTLSQDYTLRTAWDPFVRAMRFLDGATEAGRGVRVWVRAWTGLTMEVEFTGFQPPRSVAMTMCRGPWFLKQFAGVWLFRPAGIGCTEVVFRYSFRARPRMLRLILHPLIFVVFKRDIRARLRGLKRTGEDKKYQEMQSGPEGPHSILSKAV